MYKVFEKLFLENVLLLDLVFFRRVSIFILEIVGSLVKFLGLVYGRREQIFNFIIYELFWVIGLGEVFFSRMLLEEGWYLY